jgi:hypothetical protein
VRGTALIRRALWSELGGMREEFGLLADIDLWMRLAARAAVGYVAEPLITVRQIRPAYYPEIYQGRGWSWRRQRFLYEIHVANRLAHYDAARFSDRRRLSAFRLRLSLETAKWLVYALARRKWDMIETSDESVTTQDQLWLRVFRDIIRRAAKPLVRASARG